MYAFCAYIKNYVTFPGDVSILGVSSELCNTVELCKHIDRF